MTGYTVHTGSNDKFRDGWESVFGNGKKKSVKPKATNEKQNSTATSKKQSAPITGKKKPKKK